MIIKENVRIGGLISAPLVLTDVHFSRDLYQQLSRQHRFEDSDLRNFNLVSSYCLDDLVGSRVDKPGVRGGIYPVREFFESKRIILSKIAMLCAHGTDYKPGWNYWDGEAPRLINEWVSTMDEQKKYSALLLYLCNPYNFSPKPSSVPIVYVNGYLGVFSEGSIKIQLPKSTVLNSVSRFLERLVA